MWYMAGQLTCLSSLAIYLIISPSTFLICSLFLCISRTCPRTHIHSYTRVHTDTHTHTLTHIYAHTSTHAYTIQDTNIHLHSDISSSTCIYIIIRTPNIIDFNSGNLGILKCRSVADANDLSAS